MRGLFAAFIAFAVLCSATEAAGAQRHKPDQQGSLGAAVRADAPQRPLSGRNRGSKSAISVSPTFRAEDIVPDICKGCSS